MFSCPNFATGHQPKLLLPKSPKRPHINTGMACEKKIHNMCGLSYFCRKWHRGSTSSDMTWPDEIWRMERKHLPFGLLKAKEIKWPRGWPTGQVNMFRDLGMFELEWIYKVTQLGTFMKNRTCSEVILCSIPNLPHLINQCVVRADFCGSNVYIPIIYILYYLCKYLTTSVLLILILTIILMDLGCLAIGGNWWYLTPHNPRFCAGWGEKIALKMRSSWRGMAS